MRYGLLVVVVGVLVRWSMGIQPPQVPLGMVVGEDNRPSSLGSVYSVRMKEQDDNLCDAGSRQYTGWVDSHGKHLFFWYFESLQDPQEDPLTLWLTGGPGVSSMVGMLLEVGPCRVDAGGQGTRRNPWSWTRKSSMLFVDQPVGTGLSFTDPGVELPTSSAVAAEDLADFLEIFLAEVVPERRGPFHIAGESYAGHYIPALSREIVQRNQRRYDKAAIPLKSILIGNGYVSPLDTVYGYYETLCTTNPGVAQPVFNHSRCQVIADALPRCQQAYEACYQYPEACKATDEVCGLIGQFFHNESHAGGRDPFDITRVCEVEHLCYAATLDIARYMNQPSTRRALEIPPTARFSIESPEVVSAFESGTDLYSSTMDSVRDTLEHGVDVLIYNGNLDLACNTAGNLRWTSSLRWSGQAEFTSQTLKPWASMVQGELTQAGHYKEVFSRTTDSRLTFVTVDRAGHMVPFAQPQVALDLYERWLFH